ncbi:hypothetical protein BTR23_10610 [Alkalihalophilus pseudofirmus]|nr:hypothetical protein BTR23_10610 [Alkalihalophilus pseudofirmus]
MATELKIPKIGVEMTSALIDQWNIDEGSQVEQGDVLLNIQTEKVTYEIESPVSGFVNLIGNEGEEYNVGAVVAKITQTQDEYDQLNDGPVIETKKATEPIAEKQQELEVDGTSSECTKRSSNCEIAQLNRKVRSTPLAKAIARENGIDLSTINGSGPSGAIVKQDVLKAIANKVENVPTEQPTTLPEPAAEPVTETAIETTELKRVAERKPLKGMRKNIAKHMMASLQTSAQLTDINEINVSKLVQFRDELNEELADHLGYKISFNHLFIKAASIILKEHPVFNCSITDQEIIRWETINIGFAVSVDDGLVVPVIKQVDQLSLNEIASKFTELVDRARHGTLTSDDISGGTFTITNVGSYGGYFSTPILNQPEVAILGIGQIKEKPIVNENREIIVGDMLGYSLTFDHRLIDGATAGEFQKAFSHIMGNPKLLLVK